MVAVSCLCLWLFVCVCYSFGEPMIYQGWCVNNPTWTDEQNNCSHLKRHQVLPLARSVWILMLAKVTKVLVYGSNTTWYCMALRLLSMSPFVMMMPFSSTLAFFSKFSLSTRTFKRLRRTMAALPIYNTYANIWAQHVFSNKTGVFTLKKDQGWQTGYLQ